MAEKKQNKNSAYESANGSFFSNVMNNSANLKALPTSSKDFATPITRKNYVKSNKRLNINNNASITDFMKPVILKNANISPDHSSESTVVEKSFDIPHLEIPTLTRKKSLQDKLSAINNIKDDSIKAILIGIVNEISQCVDDTAEIANGHNQLVDEHTCVTDSLIQSVNNASTAVSNMNAKYCELSEKVDVISVQNDGAYDNQFINIMFADINEANDVKTGIISGPAKFNNIMRYMNISIPRVTILESSIASARRFVNGRRTVVKFLKTRFNDTVTAGRVLGRIINWNREKAENKQKEYIRYYAEMPTSKNVWKLKRICLELKKDGYLKSVRGTDRGLIAYYEDNTQEGPTNRAQNGMKTFKIRCETDIDKLREILKIDDAHVPVKEKYNDDYWKAKISANLKRSRESDDESVESVVSKKPVLVASTPISN
jgi:hypothetical protein